MRNSYDNSLNVNIFSEHDVANVLKRFIRQLDEPLLTENLRDDFLHTVNIEQVRNTLLMGKYLKMKQLLD